ncbi:hypothetical protein ACHAW5_007222 [Stephanodiscus triporus]|uniref:Pre-mRNA-splicing factor 38 n=1 Tax=Stephanodiscus triporus TaxID=2934178 RepID=A0ABD3ML27_9STRA
MSRRHILEDSDSDDNGHGGGSRLITTNNDLFTAEEKEAIEKCKINPNDNFGIYSDDYTSRAIAKVGEPPLEMVVQDGGLQLYQKYRVRVGSEKDFFERDIYKAHGSNSDACDPTCLEEAILLEIETLRRSEKAAKNRMFKNKETGGMVVFGPWFNYALQRLLQLSSSDIGPASLGEYTAIKIVRSLFSFITDNLKDVVKPGKLQALKTAMGVDWAKNVDTARKVINHCGGSAHFLYEEFVIVEAHVESLKSKAKPPPAPAAAVSPSSNKAVVPAPSKQGHVNADKEVNARNARIAAMKAHASAHLPGISAAPPQTKVSATSSANDGWGRRRDGESAAHGGQSNMESTTTRSYNRAPSYNEGKSNCRLPSSAPGLGGISDGWGRVRDGSSANQPYKTRGSWTSARRILGCNIPVKNISQERMQGGQNSDRPAPQQEAFARFSERPPPAACAASRDNFSSRDDSYHGQDRSRENYNRGGDIYNPPSRSDDYSSRSSGSRSSGHFNDRSSENRGPDISRDDRAYHRSSSRGGDRENYTYSNSRGGDYSRDNSRGEEYRSSSSREESFQNYSGHHVQGSKHSRSDDYDDRGVRPEKIYRGPSATSAPQANVSHVPVPDSAGAGRGRGAHVNQPAWMAKQEQTSAHDGPTGMPGNIGMTANSFAEMAGASSNHHPSASSGPGTNLPSSSSNISSSGMGRGRDMNLPAWMARQETAPSREFPEMGQQVPAPSVASRAPDPPAMISQYTVGESTSNGHGMGRGRGRGANKNLPAWMTNPSNP